MQSRGASMMVGTEGRAALLSRWFPDIFFGPGFAVLFDA
ncbi:MAG: hypothetical protein ACI9ZF_000744 [Bradyrhizobium sp.]|jgi:hypothetical protein